MMEALRAAPLGVFGRACFVARRRSEPGRGVKQTQRAQIAALRAMTLDREKQVTLSQISSTDSLCH